MPIRVTGKALKNVEMDEIEKAISGLRSKIFLSTVSLPEPEGPEISIIGQFSSSSTILFAVSSTVLR